MHKACIVCGSPDIFNRYIIKDFHILRCRKCGLMFVAEELSKEELDAYSKKEIAGEQEYTYTDRENIENLNYYYDRLAGLIQKQFKQGKILDVGCSAGYFLDRLPGWVRYGIEPVAFQAQNARARYGDNIHTGTLEDYACPGDFFDVITLQDSLDHMPDPLQALKKCRQLLKPQGLLVVKVHDFSCLFAQITGSKFYAFIPPFHLVYFKRNNLFNALRLAGFRVFRHKYMTQIMFLKTALFRMSQNNQKSIFFHLFNLLNRSPFKDIKLKKNLHDIITVFAKKSEC